MSGSCRCDGQNPNCCYCGGTGTVPDRLAAAFDDTSRTRAIKESDAKIAWPRSPSWWFRSDIYSRLACPKGCGLWVDPQKAEEHLRNCAGPQKTKPTPQVILKPNEGPVTSAKDPTRQDTILIAPRDKNLDATKLYAHAYREHGRWGSHPPHDGYGDESTPD